MSATLYHGDAHMIDYTPVSAVSAGDIINGGSRAYVAHKDIAANELGALAAPSGSASYKCTLATGAVFTFGAPVYADPATGTVDDALAGAFTVFFGYANEAATQSASVTTVKARHSDGYEGV